MLSGEIGLVHSSNENEINNEAKSDQDSNFQLSKVLLLNFSVGLARSQNLFCNLKI